MPWCPKCKAEYKEGFNICSKCNIELVPNLQSEEVIYDKEAFLISVANDIEAQGIESLLFSVGIPVLKRYKEAGGYLQVFMGASNFGIDLYVPSKVLDKANNILNAKFETKVEETSIYVEENMIDAIEDTKNIRRIKAWIILLFFTPVFLWICFWIIWTLLKQ